MTFDTLLRRMGSRRLFRWIVALWLLSLAVVGAGCAPEITGAAPRFVYDPAVPEMPPERPVLSLRDTDRILVLSPHPDDEVLATGGVIQQALAMDLPVRVVFLTNGDNNEFAFMFFSKAFTLDPKGSIYAGTTRAFEALRAGRELGLEGNEESFLGYPDFGTLEVWLNRWGDREAFRSMFTETSTVPYWFAITPDAPHKGEAILAAVSEVVSGFQPTKVFVSHPADTNPDHQSFYLFLRTALWDLEDEVQAEVYAYLTHYGEWPQPRGLMFDAPHEPPAKLDEPDRWVVLPLEPEQVENKLNAIKRHKTQYQASAAYLESYMRANELFDTPKDIVLSLESPSAVILPGGTGIVGDVTGTPSGGDGSVRRVRVEGDDLIFSFELPESASNGLQGDLHVMGYRGDRPFGQMAKLMIDLRGSSLRVYERRERLEDEPVELIRSSTTTEVRIPLDLLENPERVLVSAALHSGRTQLDAIPWVAIELP